MDFDVPATESAQPSELQKWLGQLQSSAKKEKEWLNHAKELVKMYEAETNSASAYNILFSNTATLAPALYGKTPRPDIQRRYKDKDPLSKSACNILQRAIEFLCDSGFSAGTGFDEAMTPAVLSALVTGRSMIRFKYEAEFEEMPESVENPGDDPAAAPLDEVDQDSTTLLQGGKQLKWQGICIETVPFDGFMVGWADRWENVPWLAFKHEMDRQELEENFGKEISSKVQLATNHEDRAKGKPDLALVWEIWDKQKREVVFVSDAYKEGVLRKTPDPLQLTNFYPTPGILLPLHGVNKLNPIPLYDLYKEQAVELNKISTRINKLLEALKVRGFYNGSIEGLEQLFTCDDNTLLPASNWAMLGDSPNAQNAIWLVPLEKVIQVLQQLYVQRQQCKQVIYELTGIADIMRGSSAASETLGAQQLKNQWGTVRLSSMQGAVAKYARDSFRILADMVCKTMRVEDLLQMTNTELPSAAMLSQIAAQGHPVPPDAVTVEAVSELLKGDLSRNFRIDIETDSTIQADRMQDRQDTAEMLNALGQFMNNVAPLVQQKALPFNAFKALLTGVARRYRMGADLETELEGMQEPKPDEGGQAEMQAKQMETQSKMQLMQAQHQAAMMELQARQEQMQLQHQVKMTELFAKAQLSSQS